MSDIRHLKEPLGFWLERSAGSADMLQRQERLRPDLLVRTAVANACERAFMWEARWSFLAGTVVPKKGVPPQDS